MISPFLKWVGGKTQILNIIEQFIPQEIDNYYEPFVGGGSVFFHMLNLLESKKITIKNLYINDINSGLINCYIDIKTNLESVLKSLKNITNVYLSFKTLKEQETFYYEKRKEYNESEQSIDKSVLFIFLNKTCFRGIFRESKNGFNVPFGNYKNPKIYYEKDLQNISNLLNKYNVYFENKSFEKFFKDKKINYNDFIYFDPPYIPLKQNSFVGYDKSLFNHELLAKYVDTLQCNFLLSNSFCETTLKLYKYLNYEKILCKRRINSKNPGDSDYEVLMYKMYAQLIFEEN